MPNPMIRIRPLGVRIRFIQTIALPAAGLHIDCIDMLGNYMAMLPTISSSQRCAPDHESQAINWPIASE